MLPPATLVLQLLVIIAWATGAPLEDSGVSSNEGVSSHIVGVSSKSDVSSSVKRSVESFEGPVPVIPETAFACGQQELPGIYADQDTNCQVFHFCQEDGRLDSFLCPNLTLFNQQYFVCDWAFNVDCSQAHLHFSLNRNLYRTPDVRVGRLLSLHQGEILEQSASQEVSSQFNAVRQGKGFALVEDSSSSASSPAGSAFGGDALLQGVISPVPILGDNSASRIGKLLGASSLRGVQDRVNAGLSLSGGRPSLAGGLPSTTGNFRSQSLTVSADRQGGSIGGHSALDNGLSLQDLASSTLVTSPSPTDQTLLPPSPADQTLLPSATGQTLPPSERQGKAATVGLEVTTVGYTDTTLSDYKANTVADNGYEDGYDDGVADPEPYAGSANGKADAGYDDGVGDPEPYADSANSVDTGYNEGNGYDDGIGDPEPYANSVDTGYNDSDGYDDGIGDPEPYTDSANSANTGYDDGVGDPEPYADSANSVDTGYDDGIGDPEPYADSANSVDTGYDDGVGDPEPYADSANSVDIGYDDGIGDPEPYADSGYTDSADAGASGLTGVPENSYNSGYATPGDSSSGYVESSYDDTADPEPTSTNEASYNNAYPDTSYSGTDTSYNGPDALPSYYSDNIVNTSDYSNPYDSADPEPSSDTVVTHPSNNLLVTFSSADPVATYSPSIPSTTYNSDDTADPEPSTAYYGSEVVDLSSSATSDSYEPVSFSQSNYASYVPASGYNIGYDSYDDTADPEPSATSDTYSTSPSDNYPSASDSYAIASGNSPSEGVNSPAGIPNYSGGSGSFVASPASPTGDYQPSAGYSGFLASAYSPLAAEYYKGYGSQGLVVDTPDASADPEFTPYQ